jgi:hypothetical protein
MFKNENTFFFVIFPTHHLVTYSYSTLCNMQLEEHYLLKRESSCNTCLLINNRATEFLLSLRPPSCSSSTLRHVHSRIWWILLAFFADCKAHCLVCLLARYNLRTACLALSYLYLHGVVLKQRGTFAPMSFFVVCTVQTSIGRLKRLRHVACVVGIINT